jgi:hypothetical protein
MADRSTTAAPERVQLPARLVSYVTASVKLRLDVQAALEGRPAAQLVNEVLDHGLSLTADEAEQLRERVLSSKPARAHANGQVNGQAPASSHDPS